MKFVKPRLSFGQIVNMDLGFCTLHVFELVNI